jgi:hypothetical protein
VSELALEWVLVLVSEWGLESELASVSALVSEWEWEWGLESELVSALESVLAWESVLE